MGRYLTARFWRLARRIGKKRAVIAVAHTILISVWHMLTNNVDYQDLIRLARPLHRPRSRNPTATPPPRSRPEALGHRVTLEPAA